MALLHAKGERNPQNPSEYNVTVLLSRYVEQNLHRPEVAAAVDGLKDNFSVLANCAGNDWRARMNQYDTSMGTTFNHPHPIPHIAHASQDEAARLLDCLGVPRRLLEYCTFPDQAPKSKSKAKSTSTSSTIASTSTAGASSSSGSTGSRPRSDSERILDAYLTLQNKDLALRTFTPFTNSPDLRYLLLIARGYNLSVVEVLLLRIMRHELPETAWADWIETNLGEKIAKEGGSLEHFMTGLIEE